LLEARCRGVAFANQQGVPDGCDLLSETWAEPVLNLIKAVCSVIFKTAEQA